MRGWPVWWCRWYSSRASHPLNRLGAATGIVLLLMLWQALMRAALLLADYVLPSFSPLWPLFVVPAAVVDGWLWLVRRHCHTG
jgi:hypothetical protein